MVSASKVTTSPAATVAAPGVDLVDACHQPALDDLAGHGAVVDDAGQLEQWPRRMVSSRIGTSRGVLIASGYCRPDAVPRAERADAGASPSAQRLVPGAMCADAGASSCTAPTPVSGSQDVPAGGDVTVTADGPSCDPNCLSPPG